MPKHLHVVCASLLELVFNGGKDCKACACAGKQMMHALPVRVVDTSPVHRQQSIMLRLYIACMQLVVVSPLMRTCETAAGVFGGAPPGSPEGELLMKRQDDSHLERSAHDAIALPADTPFVAEELVRERMGKPLK